MLVGKKLYSFGLIVTSLLLCTCAASTAASEHDDNRSERTERTWRTLDELSEEELARIDFATDTPRDANIPCLPAEPYPFKPPYTAEEMGYRIMEFPHMPRWNCVQIEDSGTLLPTGYLYINQIITLIQHIDPEGLVGQVTAKPGEVYSRWLAQDVAPPENRGNQLLFITSRTDQQTTKKADVFGYSPALRRVRRFPQPRRQDKFPNQPMAYDDFLGRDAWEFSWCIIGTDVLYETARFPNTRQFITLGDEDGSFRDVPASELKIMGDEYPYYREDGGVGCYLIEATAKDDWIPDYYVPRLLLWVDQHYFFPLRTEMYGKGGELVLLEERVGKLMNPRLKERGYHNLITLWWDTQQDFYSYGVHDSQELRAWSQADKDVFFSPDFMRRTWFPAPLKTQSGVRLPEEFFLRPHLYRDKFPGERKIVLSDDLEERIKAQEEAGHIVFTGDTADAR